MKYVIIIPDGAADLPLSEFDGKTPLEVAKTPKLDRLAGEGRLGTVATTPPAMTCGSDVCCMSLLGYDPTRYHTGRAPIEAAALGIDLDPSHWIFRVNLVTIIDGVMQDHSAGHISDHEARQLLTHFAAHVDIPAMTLYPGVSYRNIMVDVSAEPDSPVASRDWSGLTTTPPHDILGEPIDAYLPRGGRNAAVLLEMINGSADLLADHEINATRRDLNEPPATHLWPWGQGTGPRLPSFESRYGLKGAMITAVDLLAGIAQLIGWDRLDVPGQTSYHDTDYVAAGQHAIAALDDYDLVCVHIEAPDEASHAADAPTKIAAIEAIDQHVVGPIRESLDRFAPDWRLMVLPDHHTLVSTRKHDPTPVPVLFCGKNVKHVVDRRFTEPNAKQADLHITRGHELMEYFLSGGLDPRR